MPHQYVIFYRKTEQQALVEFYLSSPFAGIEGEDNAIKEA
jgi:hypothetical protein